MRILAVVLLLVRLAPAGHAETLRHTVTYDHDCYQVDGRDVYMYSGSIHYMRCPRELWADRLLKIKRAGFNTVQTIIALAVRNTGRMGGLSEIAMRPYAEFGVRKHQIAIQLSE